MKKTNLTRKIIAIVIGIIMVIGLLPISVAAAPTSVTVDAVYNTFYGTVIGGGSYNAGDTVTLTATPAEDTKFMYWLDATTQFDDNPTEEELKSAIVSYDAEYTFTATNDVTLEAVFFVANEISIVPMLITGTDDESLMNAEWVDTEGDYDTIIPGAEPLSLPGEIIEEIITIDDEQYEFVGFVVFGYDEATDTETVELKEAMTIDAMPLYGSVEYWDWFTPISDGIYAAYMEYTPDDDNDDDGDKPQPPDDPDSPDDPQIPTDPEQPDDSQTSTSPKTGDNSHMAMCVALLISGGALITLTVIDRKRKNYR